MLETLQPVESKSKKVAQGISAEGPAERMLRREIRQDEICVLIFDRPGSAANIFDQATLTQLGAELDYIAGSPEIKGVILTSAKPSVFVAGVDLKMMTR